MEGVKEQGDEELYAKLDSAYSSDEEDMEVSTEHAELYGHAWSTECTFRRRPVGIS
jgi:hypothetical protein